MRFFAGRTVPDALSDDLWLLYRDSFRVLESRAAQRHLLTRREFDEVLTDQRVEILAVLDPTQDGQPCGVACVTNDLAAVPLVSSQYFQARWPELHRRGLIWYVGFLAVHPCYQGMGVLGSLVEKICETASATGGVVAADICEYNEQLLKMPSAIARIARTFTPGLQMQRLDAQVYWAYEFPTPA